MHVEEISNVNKQEREIRINGSDESVETGEVEETIVGEEQDKAEEGEEVADESAGTESEGEAKPADEHDEVVVTIGDEKPPAEPEQKAPEWVRELRKSYRDVQRRNRELEAKLATLSGGENKPALDPGPKPTLEDAGWDGDEFSKRLEQWHDKRRQADEHAAKIRSEQDSQQKAWQAKLDGYQKAKSELRVRDFEEAEIVAQETLSVTQQGVIVNGAENPATLIYALGKNPKKAKELAAISDPVKFAFAVAKLEAQLKVSTRKAPPPERVPSGASSFAGSQDKTLERLRDEAARTGDFTKVLAYKRQRKAS